MVKSLILLICLAVCACGESPETQTASLTNGELVLGLVPLRGGTSAKDQRYRLLVCQKLPVHTYSAEVFADQSICRSALLTEDGQEVDLVGNKIAAAHKDKVIYMDAPPASEVREFSLSPASEGRSRRAGLAIVSGTLATGVGMFAIGLANEGKKLGYRSTSGFEKFLQFSVVGAGAACIFLGVLVTYVGIKIAKMNAKRKDRRERIGDEVERHYPKTRGHYRYRRTIFTQEELVAQQYWRGLGTVDFRKMTDVKYESNLRAIIDAMSKFYRLKTNESALAL